jgi:hypothetical protein
MKYSRRSNHYTSFDKWSSHICMHPFTSFFVMMQRAMMRLSPSSRCCCMLYIGLRIVVSTALSMALRIRVWSVFGLLLHRDTVYYELILLVVALDTHSYTYACAPCCLLPTRYLQCTHSLTSIVLLATAIATAAWCKSQASIAAAVAACTAAAVAGSAVCDEVQQVNARHNTSNECSSSVSPTTVAALLSNY